ncbi:hypothetical protein RB653_000275 [Dictyostelium firmibasis]|uniref:Uncharacterized protein n=1 Tax=Dictyostelium firmibasis TaxID=79012 RepID=A0AAN7U6T6_9MYCE
MEAIWHRRNQLKFNNKETTITINQITFKLVRARDAGWDKITKTINRQLRMNLPNYKPQENITWIIMKKLEKFSHTWNSKLMKIQIPKYLEGIPFL